MRCCFGLVVLKTGEDFSKVEYPRIASFEHLARQGWLLLRFSIRDFILSGRGTAIHPIEVLMDAYRVRAPVQAVHFTKNATAAGGADSAEPVSQACASWNRNIAADIICGAISRSTFGCLSGPRRLRGPIRDAGCIPYSVCHILAVCTYSLSSILIPQGLCCGNTMPSNPFQLYEEGLFISERTSH